MPDGIREETMSTKKEDYRTNRADYLLARRKVERLMAAMRYWH